MYTIQTGKFEKGTKNNSQHLSICLDLKIFSTNLTFISIGTILYMNMDTVFAVIRIRISLD